MRNFNIFAIIVLTMATFCSCNKKHWIPIDSETLKRHYSWLINDSATSIIKNTVLVPDTATAVKIAETYLFEVYGKDKIVEERPYEIGKINEYWYITGSLPKYSMCGGTFEILLEASTGKVVKIGHGK
ncbi:NTF2 fold immunity protein [Paludibacter jiangxiensis]|uniref:NTF2 fold immunity protein n=1 Tax=Paludibacter jiangxiensis TaxID=681398 RepID=A0A161LER1_9BACT|nr:NTF2 fold immunity protein [Paludibacter jiangxiensis]GAT63235.1 NTF2 fold immunity protein [Paludibacter jiangxiensis]